MITTSLQNLSLVAVLASSLLLVEGCASKKYVRQTIDPVTGRVVTLESKVGSQGTEIEGLNGSLSKTKEQLSDVDRKAGEANAAALRANENATKAGESATMAGKRADEAMTSADSANTRVSTLSRTVEGMANPSEMAKDSVYFKTNQSELSDEGTAKLDELVGKLGNSKQYVIEVHGYADPTGSAEVNRNLSERRANAVVRYLTAKNIALRSIHVIGVGEVEVPKDQKMNRTERAEMRKNSRRVDVTVFVPGDVGTNSAQK